MAPERDPYEILGVSRDATDAQIATARRRLSREYHPDVNSDPAAASRFVEIQQAFELLSDPVVRAEYDRTGRLPGRSAGARGRKAAPGILVEPAAVDFGVLEFGQPGADAEVTVSWTGTPPARIKSGQGNDWWSNLRATVPDAACVAFSLRAQAAAGTENGRRRGQFTVTLDGTTVTVGLTAEIRGVPPPPPPPVFGTAEQVPPPVPPPRRPAPARRRVSAGPTVLGLITLSFSLAWALFVSHGGGSGGPSSRATPTVNPVEVPQALASALAVRPVFHDLAGDSDLIGELVGAPVQDGFELLLPLYSASGPQSHYCVDVTVPETDPGPDRGETFVESPVGTVTVRGTGELAYPAVLPGTYTLDTDCNSETAITLGTLTVPGLGVISSLYPTDAMVVFSAHTSGNVTTVTYGAVGGNRDGIRKPPADYTCIDGGGAPGAAAYWQPVRDLVSQQVSGAQERFSIGTLVFRDSHGQSPRGTFYSSCALNTSLFQLGITVP